MKYFAKTVMSLVTIVAFMSSPAWALSNEGSHDLLRDSVELSSESSEQVLAFLGKTYIFDGQLTSEGDLLSLDLLEKNDRLLADIILLDGTKQQVLLSDIILLDGVLVADIILLDGSDTLAKGAVLELRGQGELLLSKLDLALDLAS